MYVRKRVCSEIRLCVQAILFRAGITRINFLETGKPWGWVVLNAECKVQNCLIIGASYSMHIVLN